MKSPLAILEVPVPSKPGEFVWVVIRSVESARGQQPRRIITLRPLTEYDERVLDLCGGVMVTVDEVFPTAP
jgi:hypothetical protein